MTKQKLFLALKLTTSMILLKYLHVEEHSNIHKGYNNQIHLAGVLLWNLGTII